MGSDNVVSCSNSSHSFILTHPAMIESVFLDVSSSISRRIPADQDGEGRGWSGGDVDWWTR